MKNKLNAWAVIGWLLCFSVANGQGLSDGIAVSGSAESSAPAELIRLSMTIEAQGATFKDAIEVLAKKRTKATIKLEKLSAIEDSIEFGDVTTGEGGDSAAMMQQVRQMMGDDPRMAKMLETKPPVKLSLEVQADWPLETGGESDARLIAIDQRKQEITSADLGGMDEEDKLSEQQQELAEEMASMMNRYGGRQETKAGTPQFRFVRRVTAAGYDELVGNAFADAKQQAERLASATGLSLGNVRSITSGNGLSPQAAQIQRLYGYNGDESATKSKTLDDGTVEVFGSSPAKLTLTARVSVAYDIK